MIYIYVFIQFTQTFHSIELIEVAVVNLLVNQTHVREREKNAQSEKEKHEHVRDDADTNTFD